ncbi:RAD52 motif-containing protein 1-like [Glandiceps talaboti]
MASNIEVIEFKIPDCRENNLYLTCIKGHYDEDELVMKLYEVFSQLGHLYDVQVKASNYPVIQDCEEEQEHSVKCFYAFVKYYSTNAAQQARHTLNGKPLFGYNQPILIRVANPKNPFASSEYNLPVSKCRELANYYLGFNAYSISVTSMTLDEVDPDDETITDSDKTMRCTCIATLQIPKYQIQTEGVGIGEGTYSNTDLSTKAPAVSKARKVAYNRASENAFSKLVLVIVGNGKVMVEVNNTKADLLSYINDNEQQEIIQVNQLEEVEEEHSEDNCEGAVDASELDSLNAQL